MDSTTQGIPFDVTSLTLFDSKIFSRNNQLTIRYVKYEHKILGLWQGTKPSPLDILHLNLVYCGGKYNADKELHCMKAILVKGIVSWKYILRCRHFKPFGNFNWDML